MPLLTPLQRLAAEWIWAWFDYLWESEQVLERPFARLCERVVPLLERIEAGPEREREPAIVETADTLRSIALEDFHPR